MNKSIEALTTIAESAIEALVEAANDDAAAVGAVAGLAKYAAAARLEAIAVAGLAEYAARRTG
jgi:hypothetical protein